MGESNWRQAISRVPVLGNLVSGLRGVYSLRAWRAALRQDIDDLRRDVGALSERLAQVERSRGELQEHHDRLFQALSEQHAQAHAAEQAQREGWARDTEVWKRVADAQMADVTMRVERRLSAGALQTTQLQAALDQVRAVLRESRRALAPLPDVPACLPAVTPAATALAALTDDTDAAAWREWQTLLPADAEVLVLPPEHPERWASGLQALPASSLGGIAVPAGAGGLDAAGLRAVAVAAARALAPGGRLAIRLDNPENAAVAAALCQASPAIVGWTPDALSRALLGAGLSEVTVWRLDAAEPVLSGQGEAVAAVNRLLAGPRRFIAVAARDD